MRIALVVLIGLGLIAAICAAVLVQTLTNPNAKSIIVDPDTAEAAVLVAAHPLPAMSVIDGESVVIKKVAREAVPAGALSDAVQVVGKVLTVPMVEGEAFNPKNFARDGSGLHLATVLPAGKRAVAISLTDHTGMVGLLYPGSIVDVMVSVQARGRQNVEETITRTLLQSVQVMAIGYESVTAEKRERGEEQGQLTNQPKGDQRIITLLVDPKQAQALQLAMQKGTISLAMRNPLDQQRLSTSPTRVADLWGAPQESSGGATQFAALQKFLSGLSARSAASATVAAAAPTAPAPVAQSEQWEVQIIRGTSSEVRTFKLPDKKVEASAASAVISH